MRFARYRSSVKREKFALIQPDLNNSNCETEYGTARAMPFNPRRKYNACCNITKRKEMYLEHRLYHLSSVFKARLT